ncbi:MAG: ABC transporter permease [Lachnospirales bacterium]
MYVFLLIPIIYTLVFCYYPMLGAQIAFKQFNPVDGIWGSPWVGLDQFRKFMSTPNFLNILKNTFVLASYTLIAGFPLPIILALIINSFPKKRFSKTVQTITYIPYFISTVVIVGMIIQLFNPRMGAFGILYGMFFNSRMPDILSKAPAFPHLYVWSGIWRSLGYSSIIYIAALSSVDEEMHEAAQIDGASRFQRVRHIDFPSILPTAIIMLILSSGSIMNVGFEKVYLMQNNLNLSQSEVISTYVYKIGLTQGTGDFSFAAAIGLFNSIINFGMLVFVNTVSKKVSKSSLW